jgi:hypothetical protein
MKKPDCFDPEICEMKKNHCRIKPERMKQLEETTTK